MPPLGRAGIVGRTAEVEAVERLLGAAGARAAALVLDGEAGIGKTTVWLAGVEAARAAGFRVLTCRPAEAEVALPFVALGDLLDPVIDEALPRIPAPLQSALGVALQREDATDPASRLAISRAVLAILRSEVTATRTVIAIDDAQWLDRSTADVLAFALRRLADAPARVLVARRSDDDDTVPLGLSTAFDADRLERRRIGPLSVEELDQVIRTQLGIALPRPRLLELAERTAGNSFYALEIARSSAGTGGSLQIPKSLTALLRSRLGELSDAARTTVLYAAAASQPTEELLTRATREGDGLREASSAGILAPTRERVRFTHPLIASTALADASRWDIRQAHHRLAELTTDPVERARHLGEALDEPDKETADQLEAAAEIALSRGAPEAAALLQEHAARLTPRDDPSTMHRRRSEAADHHIASGDPTRGRTILRELVDELPPGPEHATYLIRLADAGGIDLESSIRMGERALVEAGNDPKLLAEIETTMSVFTWINGDIDRSIGHVRRSAEHAAASGDDLAVATALGEAYLAAAVTGRPLPEADIERAIAIEKTLTTFPPYQRPSFQRGIVLTYRDQPDAARPLLLDEFARIDASGDEAARCGVVFRLADLEWRVGNWQAAAKYARESMQAGLQAGIVQEQGIGLMIHAQVQAHIGDLAEAERRALRAVETSGETRDTITAIRAKGVLGFIELTRGRPDVALSWLTPARQELARMGNREVSIHQVVNNELEALIATDNLDEAERVADQLAAVGLAMDSRAWHAAVAARAHALIASARGDGDGARRALGRAFEAHERLPQPFERGRTLLAQGTIERRDRSWAAARAALTQALDVFDRLGAARWAERAAADLQRLPGRPAAARGAGTPLTETERRIAELVTEGLSNKEIAARLFVAVRTVEANLTRIYEKLGLRSRTELARHRFD